MHFCSRGYSRRRHRGRPSPASIRRRSRAIGRQGQFQGDVYKISLPRTDLDVRVGGVKIRAGFALGSWVAFRATGPEAIVHGDLVLTGREVDPVIARLFASGLRSPGSTITWLVKRRA